MTPDEITAATTSITTFPQWSFSTYNPQTWTGRETIAQQLINRCQIDCRLVLITGITGIGKTTLAERIAAQLQPARYYRITFDRGEDRDFLRGAATILEQMGSKIATEERHQPLILLNQLIQQLEIDTYWLQLDAVEALIDPATATFRDPLWVEFLTRFIKLDNCESRIVITSQIQSRDLTQKLERGADNYWQHQPLIGLPASECLELFKNYGVVSENPTDRSILTQIAEFYAGHIYVLQIIAGGILAAPFNGEIERYWRKYRAKFGGNLRTSLTSVTLDRDELAQRIERQIKISLEQLPELAQTLIKRSSIYRRAVPESFYLLLIADIHLNPEPQLIQPILDRFFIKTNPGDGTETYLIQHNLIRQVANKLLKADRQEYSATETKAMGLWLQLYEKPADSVSNLEILRGQIEAFYHAVNIEAWELASAILLSNEFSPTDRFISYQLGVWGYYQTKIELNQQLLGKLGEKIDSVCLTELGNAYGSIGDVDRAINCHQQGLIISRQMKDLRGEGSDLGNLGNAYLSLHEYPEAIDYYQQALTISHAIGDLRGTSHLVGNLGKAYLALGQYLAAIDYYQQALTLSRELGDLRGMGNRLGNLGTAYLAVHNYPQAIDYYQQALTLAQMLGDIQAEASELGNLGNAYLSMGNYLAAIDCYQQALTSFREIGDVQAEASELGNLGSAYLSLENYPVAIDYYQQAQAIFDRLGDREPLANTLFNLAILARLMQQVELAKSYSDRALEIATELGIPLVAKCQALQAELQAHSPIT